MAISVEQVSSRAALSDFIRLPWRIYRGNRCWVAPLVAEQRRELRALVPPAPAGGRALLLARENGRAAARLSLIVVPSLNASKGAAAGYFSLFECVPDQAVARALFEAAGAWMLSRGLSVLKGPVSPDGPHGDEQKGLLLDAFDRPPVVLTSYNPPYYRGLLEAAGFEKDLDLFAYRLDKDRLFARDPGRAIDYAARRYGFRLDPIDLSQIEREIDDITRILEVAVPAEWEDMVAPSKDEVRRLAERLRPVADPDLVVIARAGGQPVGFGVALPDYNQALIHLGGRRTPLSILRFLYHKRRIDGARIFILFVVPSFRKKGVAHAIYYRIFKVGTGKGYTWGEGSTIGEPNTRMRADIESIGGVRDKTYRIYRKRLTPPAA